MTRRRSRKIEVQTGQYCPLYPTGRRDARLHGRVGRIGRIGESGVCTTADACPPDGEFPDYDQVLQVRRRAPGRSIASSCDIWERYGSLRRASQEHFWVIGTDNRNRPVMRHQAALGGRDAVNLDMRVIFAPLLLSGSNRFFILHNHPSGDPTPSPDDVAITRKIAEAGRYLDLPLLDHVILGDTGYVSLRDAGLIKGER